MPTRLAHIERRIADLERSRRHLRLAVVGLLAAAVSLGASRENAATPATAATDRLEARTVVAEAVQLVDRDGKLRTLISARAGVSMLDEQGRPRAVLSIDASGPGLLLYGETSRAGGSLTVNRDGPALALRDNDGRTRALLATIAEGPALLFTDEDERERVALVQRAGGGSIRVLDADGTTAWSAASRR